MTLGIEKLNSTGTLTKVELGSNVTVYYSYSIPVAIACKEAYGATDKKYSVTTSKHIALIGMKDKKIKHEEFKELLKKYNVID